MANVLGESGPVVEYRLVTFRLQFESYPGQLQTTLSMLLTKPTVCSG